MKTSLCSIGTLILRLLPAALLALASVSPLQADEYELLLEQAVPGGDAKGDFPLQILMRHNGSGFVDGVALSTYSALAGSGGLYETYPVDVSQLVLNNGEITGTLTTQVGGTSIAAGISVQEEDHGFLRGVYQDQNRSPQRVRGIEGQVHDPLNLTLETRATLILEDGVPPGRRGEAVFWSFRHENGTVDEVSLHYAELLNSLFGLDTGEPQQSPFITASGLRTAHMGGNGEAYVLNVVSHSLTLTATSLSGQTTFDLVTDSGPVRYVYEVDAQIIAGHVLGTVTTRDDSGAEVDAAFRVAGHIAVPQPPETPDPVSPLTAAPAQAGSSFSPPYFDEITQQDFRDRLRAAALWFGQSDYVGAYRSDLTTVLTRHTNNKQYDNGSENTYGGVMGLLMLHRLSDDPAVAGQALRAAQRAGYWSQALGSGRWNILPPYKGLFYTTFWQAWAYLELYLYTGDAEWKDQALRYALGLEELQELMYENIQQASLELAGNDIGGTWTYYTPSSGYAMGESDSRTNRDRDWHPIQAGERLLFLGRLRVEAGITDFLEVEQKAYAWMLANLDDDWTWYTKNTDGQGPSAFLLYMLRYAETAEDADIDQVLTYLENNHTDWSHDDTRLSPAVKYESSRRQSEDGANTSTTLRTALVYMNLWEQRGDATYLAKAKALIYSVLSRQNTYGYLHHNGLQFTDPGAEASFAVRYNERPGHSYTNLSADTVRLLHECYRELARLDAFAGGAGVVADLEADSLGGTVPLSVSFDASGSSGTGLTYHWDFGDGQQGSGATPGHTYAREGNFIVTLTVESGSTTDTRQVLIRARQPQVLTSVQVESVENHWGQNPIDFFDPVDYLRVGQTRAYTATALDQYGDPMQPQPGFTWSATGGNSVDAGGLLTAQAQAADVFLFELAATATSGGETVSGQQGFRVLGDPEPGYRGVSLNFNNQGEDGAFAVGHPEYTGGVIKLDRWQNFGTESWGGGSGLNGTATDNRGEHTITLNASKVNGRDSGVDAEITNTDLLISIGALEFRDDAGLTISGIPEEYRTGGYDLYVYRTLTMDNTHSVRLRIGNDVDQTVWLKGKAQDWDGVEYNRATAATEAEAAAGGFTNYVLFENLQAETLNIDASSRINAIQIVKSTGELEDQAPTIQVHPQGADLTVGDVHTLSVVAFGVPEPQYQWSRDGAVIDGATAESLTLDPAALDDAGVYTVEVANSQGTVQSSPATITVQPRPPLVRILVDFGNALDDPVGNWNQAVTSTTTGLLTADGHSTGVGVSFTNWAVSSSTTHQYTDDDSGSPGPSARTEIPGWAGDQVVALNDRLWLTDGQSGADAAVMTLSGLDPARSYRIEIASSQAGSGTSGDEPGYYRLEGAQGTVVPALNGLTGEALPYDDGMEGHVWTKRVNAPDGEEGWLLWENVAPNAEGEIVLMTRTGGSNTSRGGLNAMLIQWDESTEGASLQDWLNEHGIADPDEMIDLGNGRQRRAGDLYTMGAWREGPGQPWQGVLRAGAPAFNGANGMDIGFTAQPNRIYVLQSIASLTDPAAEWTDAAPPLAQAGEQVFSLLPPGEGKRFYRIKVDVVD